jgi:hypothetical protein
MKNTEYYENVLRDLKKEQGRESQLIKNLTDMHKKLRDQAYQPLDPLEGVIRDLEARRTYIKNTIEDLEKAGK